MHQYRALRRGLALARLHATAPDRSRSQTHARVWLTLALALFPVARAAGQILSPAEATGQELLREQERTRVLRQQQERSPDVRLPLAAGTVESTLLRFDESPCFSIHRIVLEGEGAAQFQWALAAANQAGAGRADSPIGHCLGTAAIDLLLRRVQNAILDRGYITTRVLVGSQNLSAGTLAFTLIPGRVRAIRALPGSGRRATLWNAVPAAPGKLLNLRDVEQALENLKRVPTAQADIQIIPAEAADAGPGESDLGIQWNQNFPLRVSLSVDDSGSAATGHYQGGVTVSYDHLLALNDLFYLSLNHDLDRAAGEHGTRGGTIHYSLPFGYWLLGATASASTYRQTVAGANQTYLYSGDSQNGGVTLSRVVYRDATRKSIVSLRGWVRASRNFVDDTEVEVQHRRMAGWEIGVEQRELIGAATLEVRLNYRHGSGALKAERAPEEVFGEGTSRFALLALDGNASVPFALAGQRLRYYGSWRMQYNHTPLIAQDRFAIGGRYTVRGFDGDNSLIAERGWLLRNEVSAALGASGHEVYVGLDHGAVDGPSSVTLAGTHLTGAVLGLRGQFKQFQYEVFGGAPLRKPAFFRSASRTAGFSLSLNF